MRGAVIGAGFLLVALAGCEPALGPEQTWRAFSQAAQRLDSQAAWALLDAPTQAFYTDAARSIAEERGQAAPADGRRLLFLEISPPRSSLKEVTAIHEGGSTFVVTIDDAGQRGRVPMVQEEGRWKISLRPLLDEARRPPGEGG